MKKRHTKKKKEKTEAKKKNATGRRVRLLETENCTLHIQMCVFVKTQTKTLPDTKQVKDGDNSDIKQKKHDMAERNFGTEENESGRRKNSGKKKKGAD